MSLETQSAELPESHFVEVNGLNIHYHDVGSGPVLFMFHGSGPGASGWSNFNRNVNVLAEKFRVIVPDMPGFGKSDIIPDESPVYSFWTKIFIDMMKVMGIPSAHFVGNSGGGMVALKMAMECPDMVNRLILMGPGGGVPLTTTWPTEGIKILNSYYDEEGPTIEKLKRFVDQFLYDPSQLTDELIETRYQASIDPRFIDKPPMRNMTAAELELWRDERISKLPHEVLITWGREDRVLPLDMAFVLMKQIPKARLFVMPQCGHWIQWEHAEEFNRTVTNFLLEQ
ncbi:MAG: alpha/beta fold hydrolase [Emcibacter sp.]|nr:alpha/beta fold hydrolase [Emcibacter sp.]